MTKIQLITGVPCLTKKVQFQQFKLLILFAFIVFVGCKKQTNEAIIRGKIVGNEIPEKVEYTIPVNNVAFWLFRESTPVDSTGNFEIKLNMEYPSLILINREKGNVFRIIAEPGNVYEVELNLLGENDKLTVLKGNTKAQNAFNAFNQDTPNAYSVIQIFDNDSLTPDEIITNINQAKKEEIKILEELFENGETSKAFFDIAKNIRDCYYDIVWQSISSIRYWNATKSIDSTLNKQAKEYWSASFHEDKIFAGDYYQSPYFSFMLQSYIYYKIFEENDFDSQKLKETRKSLYGEDASWHTIKTWEAKKVLEGEILEYYLASYISRSAFQKKYEKELISLFKDFKNEYPKSNYQKYIVPLIEPIAEFYEKVDGDFSATMKFVDDHGQINNFSDAIKDLKGKKLYVDVWATWCGPCKHEFQYKEELKKVLQKYDFEVLYISVDKDNLDEQWKNMIEYYDLEGYHIRANKDLKNDLEKVFDTKKNGHFSIPFFILVDKDGTIVKTHAKRPSQIKELEDEIKAII